MGASETLLQRTVDGSAPMIGAGKGAVRQTTRHLRRRLAAFVVDTCLLSALIFLGAAILWASLGAAVRFTTTDARLAGEVLYDARILGVTSFAGIATGFVYFSVSWLALGATPGQRLYHLEVRDEHGGARPTLGRATARWVALGAPLWIASSLVPGWPGVVAATALFLWVACLLLATARSTTGQGWHDRLSGTRVVLVRRAHRGHAPRDRHVR